MLTPFAFVSGYLAGSMFVRVCLPGMSFLRGLIMLPIAALLFFGGVALFGPDAWVWIVSMLGLVMGFVSRTS